MRGYKAFNQDMTCHGMQYEVGKVNTQSGELELCKNGLHFCDTIDQCFYYYPEDSIICEVEAVGDVVVGDDKNVTDALRVIRVLDEFDVSMARYGNGYGDGDSSDSYGRGFGCGYSYGGGFGWGSTGYGGGLGNGLGCGYDYGYGNGYGDGYGYGNGYGDGYGYGDAEFVNGYGSGLSGVLGKNPRNLIAFVANIYGG